MTTDVSVIRKYFPLMNSIQESQLEELGKLYPEWNEKINVISRKDIDNLYINHVLHSLSIAKFLSPVPGTSFIDVGTGGGFPGIPLAIMCPECSFHLIDRIGKKIKVVHAIKDAIGLKNVTTQHGDLGECHERFDFAVSRAVMSLPELWRIVKPHIKKAVPVNPYSNGLIALKGGDIKPEIDAINGEVFVEDLSLWFKEPYFDTKKLIYIPY